MEAKRGGEGAKGRRGARGGRGPRGRGGEGGDTYILDGREAKRLQGRGRDVRGKGRWRELRSGRAR